MTALQQAAQAAIKKHKSVRKAAKSLDMDHAYLYRISTGERTAVGPDVAAKLGVEQTWKRL